VTIFAIHTLILDVCVSVYGPVKTFAV